MKLTVVEKKENPIFSRTELKFEVSHEKFPTPSRIDVENLISANVSSKEGLISINSIHSIFGQNKSSGNANIYKKAEDLKKYEPAYLVKRAEKVKEKAVKAEAAPAPAEAPAEQPASEEKPAEGAKPEGTTE